jgi:hypothetical protein
MEDFGSDIFDSGDDRPVDLSDLFFSSLDLQKATSSLEKVDTREGIDSREVGCTMNQVLVMKNKTIIVLGLNGELGLGLTYGAYYFSMWWTLATV